MAEKFGDLLEDFVEYPVQPVHEFFLFLKLSRLFLNKISKETSKKSHPVSEEDTAQLLNLIELTLPIPTKLSEFYADIKSEDEPPNNINLKKLVDLAKLFHIPLNFITNHLNDQGAKPNSPDHNFHVNFIQWYANWLSHFSLAIRRLHISYKDVHSDFLV
jgi:hypothetical protein